MKKFNSFIKDDWARIPFSIIGVFLLIGASITTVYIAELEEEKAKEISFTLDKNTMETVIRYAEADLARALNNAASQAFLELGQNPVITDAIDEYKDIHFKKVNQNIMAHMTLYRFNTYVEDNFRNNRFQMEEFIVHCKEFSVDDWNSISVQNLEMNIDRGFNHPLFAPITKHSAYVVLSYYVTLEIYDEDATTLLFTKQSKISTIITSRFPLMQSLTDEFDNRLTGTTSSLGISILGSAMGLTWLRGYAQYFLKKPSNIISNDYLAIITNTGILLEQGFVFNSVDAVDIVFIAYETVKALLDDLGKTDNIPKFDRLKGIMQNPLQSADISQYYTTLSTEFEDELPVDVLNPEAEVSMDLEEICDYVYNSLLNDDTNQFIKTTINNIYTAELKTDITRSELSNNGPQIQQTIGNLLQQTKNTEKTRRSDAEKEVQQYLPDDWWVKAEFNNIWFSNYNEDHDDEFTTTYSDPVETIPFNNNNPHEIIFFGETYHPIHTKNMKWEWKYRSSWTVTFGNDTLGPFLFPVRLDSEDYTYEDVHTIIEKVTYKFISTNYAHGKQILNPFAQQQFFTYSDPNLAFLIEPDKTMLDYYKSLIRWEEDNILDKIIKGDSNERRKTIQSTSSVRLHQYWLDNEITKALNYFKDTISTIEDTSQITPENTVDFLDTFSNQVLINNFNNEKQNWLNKIDNDYRSNLNYKSAAAKILYLITTEYINRVEQKLNSMNFKQAIETQIDEELTNKGIAHSFDSMKGDSDKATGLLSSLQNRNAFPIAQDITLAYTSGAPPQGWTEKVNFAVSHKPSFLSAKNYKDYHEAGYAQGVIYEIKYINTNIFSPGAAITDVVEIGFSAVNQQIIGSLDEGFSKLQEIIDEGDQEVSTMVQNSLNDITTEIKNKLRNQLKENLGLNQQTSYLSDMGLLTDNDINTAIDQVLNQYATVEDKIFIENLNNNEIADEIINKLIQKAHQNADSKYATDEFLDEIKENAIQLINSHISVAFEYALTQTLTTAKDLITTTYESVSKNLETVVNKKLQNLVGSIIPAGLPILPYVGWVITLNIWIIEIEGEIPMFSVVDTRNEAHPHPLFGHVSQEYHRTKKPVVIDLNGDGQETVYVGENKEITFDVTTGTFIIVPGGLPGVGDRSGGYRETSKYPE